MKLNGSFGCCERVRETSAYAIGMPPYYYLSLKTVCLYIIWNASQNLMSRLIG